MKKGDYITINGSDKILKVVGRYGDVLVLSDTGDNSEEVILCTAMDVEEVLTEDMFKQLRKKGIKITEEEGER